MTNNKLMINRATAAIPMLSLLDPANTTIISGQNCRNATFSVLNAIRMTANGDCLDGMVNMFSNFFQLI